MHYTSQCTDKTKAGAATTPQPPHCLLRSGLRHPWAAQDSQPSPAASNMCAGSPVCAGKQSPTQARPNPLITQGPGEPPHL